VPPALQLINTGKVRALGVTTAKRIAVAPDVPPIADTVPGYDSAPWQMLAARAGTPAAIIDKLHAEVKAIIAAPDVQKQMVEMGLIPGEPATPAELVRFLESEIVRWGKIVHQAGAAGIE
jgi:tripartite-type tricarboxylate transporter receptor subunit TctC